MTDTTDASKLSAEQHHNQLTLIDVYLRKLNELRTAALKLAEMREKIPSGKYSVHMTKWLLAYTKQAALVKHLIGGE